MIKGDVTGPSVFLESKSFRISFYELQKIQENLNVLGYVKRSPTQGSPL